MIVPYVVIGAKERRKRRRRVSARGWLIKIRAVHHAREKKTGRNRGRKSGRKRVGEKVSTFEKKKRVHI